MAAARPVWNFAYITGIDTTRSQCCGELTNGQHCTKDISLATQQVVRRLLQTMTHNEPTVAYIWLDRFARLLLCETTHQHQATGFVDQWKRKIDDHVAKTRRLLPGYQWTTGLQIRENHIRLGQRRIRERGNTGPHAANRQPATATEATDKRDRQIPDLVIGEPVSGAANPTEVERDGELNSMREQLAGQQVEIEELGSQAAATANEPPASPVSTNRTEDTPTNSIIHRSDAVNTPQEAPTPTPASDNDASPINHPPEPVNISQEAPAPDATPSLSGECPICYEDLLNGGTLICCQAQCRRYLHRRCRRSYVRRSGDTRCPYW